MILVIDIGNTTINFALFKHENTLEPEPFAHYELHNSPHRTSKEYWFWLSGTMTHDNISPHIISSITIASVVPHTLNILLHTCHTYLHQEPFIFDHLTPGRLASISPSIPSPHTVGADRIANAEAAAHFYQGLRIIVDIGTATTFDIIDSHNAYLGGIICPGLQLSRDTLSQATAKLPWITLDTPPKNTIGTTTELAMASGLLYGYASMIDGLVARITQELQQNYDVLVTTGGTSHLFSSLISSLHQNDPFLTLKGLAAWSFSQPHRKLSS